MILSIPWEQLGRVGIPMKKRFSENVIKAYSGLSLHIGRKALPFLFWRQEAMAFPRGLLLELHCRR